MLLTTINVTGNVKAKGRNGYFQAKEIDVFTLAEDETAISVYSGSPLTKNPPIVLRGNRDEVLSLLDKITKTIKGV